MVLTHYQLLGIPVDADNQAIKIAYRSMAKRFHPDTNAGSDAAAELFRQLSEAYRVLSNPELRKSYDRSLDREKPAPTKTKDKKSEPRDKFNRFINSVLDAILETPDKTPDIASDRRVATAPKPAANPPHNKPDFNFYYYLAMERQKSPYNRSEDGIYRRKKRPGPGKATRPNRFGKPPVR